MRPGLSGDFCRLDLCLKEKEKLPEIASPAAHFERNDVIIICEANGMPPTYGVWGYPKRGN
jgi:hypothetical protein